VSNNLSLSEIKKYVKDLKVKPTSTLQVRLDEAHKQFKKLLVAIEKDPKRLQKAEKLLQQLENFLG
jgi:DNA repair ATPase RecN